jgi:NTP pyrophosphatase (non-canonical NTP hydrolase)
MKLLRIIQHYGLEHQKRKLIEEVYELLDAEAEMQYSSINFANNYERLLNHIIEEIADCYVLIEQHRKYWDIDVRDVEKVFKYKINRTLKEMEDEKLLRPTTGIRNSKRKTANSKGKETNILQ